MNSFLLQHYLDASLSRVPEQTAITDGDRAISYHELTVFSNKIAHCLKTMGVNRQDRVIILMQRSILCLASIFGVLKADAIYVPIDSKTPVDRLAGMIETLTPVLLICDSRTLPVVSGAQAKIKKNSPILVMSPAGEVHPVTGLNFMTIESVDEFMGNEPAYENKADDIAYILFTSGSSGQPKGVMVSHANVQGYIEWAVEHFRISQQDHILGTAPFQFDMSVFDIYCALKTGAKLCVASEMQSLFPEKLVDFIEQQQVTLWKGVSSLLMYMARTGVLKPGRMPSLKQVLFAGETLPTRYLIEWMTHFPDKTFYNAYGPTEATGVSACYRIESIPESPQERIPIGAARRGSRIFLLSEDEGDVAPGEIGEICITGDGLASGYFDDDEKTDKSFVQNRQARSDDRAYKTGDIGRQRPDGIVEYLGRKDRQLKFMGYRIEAGEIEQALLSMPFIQDTAVNLIASRQNGGMMELVAFWEAEDDIPLETICSDLKKLLPPYMIPKRFVRVSKMPRCDRGKINLEALNQYNQHV